MLKKKSVLFKKLLAIVLAILLLAGIIAGVMWFVETNRSDISELSKEDIQQTYLSFKKLAQDAQENGDCTALEKYINQITVNLGQYGMADLQTIATFAEEEAKNNIQGMAQAMIDNPNMKKEEYSLWNSNVFLSQKIYALWYVLAKIPVSYNWPKGIIGFTISDIIITRRQWAFTVQVENYVIFPANKKEHVFTVKAGFEDDAGKVRTTSLTGLPQDKEKTSEKLTVVEKYWTGISSWAVVINSSNDALECYKSFIMNAEGLYGMMYLAQNGMVGLAEQVGWDREDIEVLKETLVNIQKTWDEEERLGEATLAQKQAHAIILGKPVPEVENMDPVEFTEALITNMKDVSHDMENRAMKVMSFVWNELVKDAYKHHSGYLDMIS